MRRCRASGAWVSSTGAARLPHGTEQRFYRALVDARDRPRATISYVAEANLIALAARREAGFIVHPLLRVAGRAAAAAATDSGSESEPEDDARRGLGVSKKSCLARRICRQPGHRCLGNYTRD
jgi:hypothetical protein